MNVQRKNNNNSNNNNNKMINNNNKPSPKFCICFRQSETHPIRSILIEHCSEFKNSRLFSSEAQRKSIDCGFFKIWHFFFSKSLKISVIRAHRFKRRLNIVKSNKYFGELSLQNKFILFSTCQARGHLLNCPVEIIYKFNQLVLGKQTKMKIFVKFTTTNFYINKTRGEFPAFKINSPK